MIKGKIEHGLHPKINLEMAGKTASGKFSMLVDTGFDSDVALHHHDAVKLGLTRDTHMWIDYADGARIKESVGFARVLWHGKWKDVEVIISNDEEPAIGTQLLQGSVATLDFVKNKLVIAEPRRKR